MNENLILEKVKAEKERLELILASTSEGWWEWDLVSNETYHSPHWYIMLGFSADEFASSVEMWLSLVHPDDRDRAFEQQNSHMQKDNTWEIEFRMKTRDRGFIWVLSRGKVVSRNENGNPLKVVGIHLDIHEKVIYKKLKEEKEVQEELMQGIVRVSHSSFKIYDFVSQKFLYTAGNIYAQLGYDQEEFMRLSLNFVDNLVHSNDQSLFRKYVEEIKQTNTNSPGQLVFRMKAKSGAFHWITTQDAVFRRDKDGKPLQIIGSAIDITARRSLEEKMEKHLRYLEDLSYKNSHELRGPVATLLGLTHLLLQETGEESVVGKMVAYLQRTVQKLDLVIGDLNREIDDQSAS